MVKAVGHTTSRGVLRTLSNIYDEVFFMKVAHGCLSFTYSGKNTQS